MMRIRIISIIAALVLLTTAFTFADAETTRKLTLEDLAVRLLEDSPEIKQIEITARLNELQYKQSKKDYEELKDKVVKARESWEASKKALELTAQAYSSSGTPLDNPAYQGTMQQLAYSYTYAEAQYKALVKQEVALLKSMESLMQMGKQVDRRRDQEIEKQKYSLQKEYLNLVYLTQQRDLMNTRLKNLQKDIIIEKLRKDLNLTTQFYIENLESQVNTLAFNIKQMDINIESATEALKTKVGYSIEDEFNIELKILQLGNPRPPYALSRLASDFNRNNLDLELLKNNITSQKQVIERMKDVYEADDLEFEKAQLTYEEDILKLKKLERSYEAAVKNAYYGYLRATENHTLQLKNKELAEDRYRHAEAQFKAGLISQRQLENQRYDLDQFMLDFNKSLIDFYNIRTELDLIGRGIL